MDRCRPINLARKLADECRVSRGEVCPRFFRPHVVLVTVCPLFALIPLGLCCFVSLLLCVCECSCVRVFFSGDLQCLYICCCFMFGRLDCA